MPEIRQMPPGFRPLGYASGEMLRPLFKAPSGAPPGFVPPSGPATRALVPFVNPSTGETWDAPSGGYTPPEGWQVASSERGPLGNLGRRPDFGPPAPMQSAVPPEPVRLPNPDQGSNPWSIPPPRMQAPGGLYGGLGAPNLGGMNPAPSGAPPGFIPPSGPATHAVMPFVNPSTGETWDAPSGGYTPPEGWQGAPGGLYGGLGAPNPDVFHPHGVAGNEAARNPLLGGALQQPPANRVGYDIKPGSASDQDWQQYLGAKASAQKQRDEGFMGRVVLPGEGGFASGSWRPENNMSGLLPNALSQPPRVAPPPPPIAPPAFNPGQDFPDTNLNIPTIFGNGSIGGGSIGGGSIGGGVVPALNSLRDLAMRGNTDLNSVLYGSSGGGSVPLRRV
jgi:hypothetical protein